MTAFTPQSGRDICSRQSKVAGKRSPDEGTSQHCFREAKNLLTRRICGQSLGFRRRRFSGRRRVSNTRRSAGTCEGTNDVRSAFITGWCAAAATVRRCVRCVTDGCCLLLLLLLRRRRLADCSKTEPVVSTRVRKRDELARC